MAIYNASELFSENVFTDAVMQKLLSKQVYEHLKAIRDNVAAWNDDVADEVANAMRVWAMERGATHYTHWFTPMTGMSAGKHDAFLSDVVDGKPLFKFSGNTLTKGESDASSLPSGGLRETFEARGYTAWDPTSPAFIIGETLYIPTAFCSYNGEALDQKTPLLRSMQAVGKQAVALLHKLGMSDVKTVYPTVGAEQEYFLIDREFSNERLDMQICGRTLFGAKPPKGQELGDHYYGRIRTRVISFMEELDKTLWSLGIPSKTRHNETAPAQYEVAAIFSTVNIACDHNQLLMQVIRPIARKHGFYCLLHEKPFEGINGSGKHNNWSLVTDTGVNLFNPSDNPENNLRFLLFVAAVIRAVDKFGDLIRLSASSAGNDLRLGGNEAPPSVISIFLGDHLSSIFQAISDGAPLHSIDRSHLMTGVKTLPLLELDDCDRNRTSPFAFTGNKFEFRMVGSSQSIGFPNTVLDTVVADSLEYINGKLNNSTDIETDAKSVIAEIYQKHGRVVFNGNNYSDEWKKEAERRGLKSYPTTREAVETLLERKNIELFEHQQVLSEVECVARHEILLNNYVNVVSIEAGTMLEMLHRQILPACISYCGSIADSNNSLISAGHASKAASQSLAELVSTVDGIYDSSDELENAFHRLSDDSSVSEKSAMCAEILALMSKVRGYCDAAEHLVSSKVWPLPNYMELLYKQ